MGKEIWKVIPGFELYQISNTGKVLCSERIAGNRVIHQRIIKGTDNGLGYRKVVLKQDGKKKREYIHRLVAEAFLDNPEDKPFINHIDCNPQNNNVENLEWCTAKENYEWMAKLGRNTMTAEWLKNLHKSQEKTYVSVVGENLKTGEKIYFSKLNDVRKLGFQPSCVCVCCKGNNGVAQHKGYRWSYEKIDHS